MIGSTYSFIIQCCLKASDSELYTNDMLMLCRPRGGSEKQMLAIDARETAPASTNESMFHNRTTDYFGTLKTLSLAGRWPLTVEAGCFSKKLGWRFILRRFFT